MHTFAQDVTRPHLARTFGTSRPRDPQPRDSHGRRPGEDPARAGSEPAASARAAEHAFGRVAVYPPAPMGAPRDLSALTRVGAAPQPQTSATPAPPRPQPGAADLYITVTSPAKITTADMFARPIDSPSSGISYQFSRHASFHQDEYLMGVLRWAPNGSKLAEATLKEEAAVYHHEWEGHTVERTDLPGNPILLDASDTHLYGLSTGEGAKCEAAAKRNATPFDRRRDEWTFDSQGKFIDTVTFPDREIKRAFYSDFRATKKGRDVQATIRYTNVDRVDRI
jgi:hypothetical protein